MRKDHEKNCFDVCCHFASAGRLFDHLAGTDCACQLEFIENPMTQKAAIYKPYLQKMMSEKMKISRVKTWGFTLSDPLVVQILYAPHRLNIADFAKIPPCFRISP